MKSIEVRERAYKEALGHLQETMASGKCQACGCFHNLLQALEKAFPKGRGPEELLKLMTEAKRCLAPPRADCLGCEVCLPPLVLNALSQTWGETIANLEICASEPVIERPGWPPLPGAYQVLRYQAPVAVCTLTSEDLTAAVVQEAGPEIALVGTLHTENLGIERIIQNILANPFLRFVVVCGQDSLQAVGHYPGQAFVALAQQGIDEHQRIIEARGRRPVLKNLNPKAVIHFREVVQVLDLISETDVMKIISEAKRCAARNPGPASPYSEARILTPVQGYLPSRHVGDPSGYFVIYVDRARGMLSLEHYRNDGLLETVIEGRTAAELYTPAIDRGLLSRLEHAAYLGRELARAEESLHTGVPFVQDAAPEQAVPPILTGITCEPDCRQSGT